MEKENCRIALFIDAENQPNGYEELFEELSKVGQVIYRRAYGKILVDGGLAKELWEELEEYGCTVLGHTSEKENATDKRLIADAVSIITEKEIDAICIVSGDGHYLPLINIAREKGLRIIIASHEGNLSEKTKYNCDKLIVLGDGKENKQEKTDENNEQEDKILEIAKKILKNSGKNEMDLGGLCKALYKDDNYKELMGEERIKNSGKFFTSEKAQKIFNTRQNTNGNVFISLK